MTPVVRLLPAVTNPGLSGLSLYLQAALLDGAAAQGLAISNGLELEIG